MRSLDGQCQEAVGRTWRDEVDARVLFESALDNSHERV
jgi:hypothetical protein